METQIQPQQSKPSLSSKVIIFIVIGCALLLCVGLASVFYFINNAANQNASSARKDADRLKQVEVIQSKFSDWYVKWANSPEMCIEENGNNSKITLVNKNDSCTSAKNSVFTIEGFKVKKIETCSPSNESTIYIKHSQAQQQIIYCPETGSEFTLSY